MEQTTLPWTHLDSIQILPLPEIVLLLLLLPRKRQKDVDMAIDIIFDLYIPIWIGIYYNFI